MNGIFLTPLHSIKVKLQFRKAKIRICNHFCALTLIAFKYFPCLPFRAFLIALTAHKLLIHQNTRRRCQSCHWPTTRFLHYWPYRFAAAWISYNHYHICAFTIIRSSCWRLQTFLGVATLEFHICQGNFGILLRLQHYHHAHCCH